MFRSMREDRDVIKGASVRGIIGLSIVAKPNRDVFFRTHPDYSSIIPIVDVEQDMKKDWYAVTDDVVGALARIGITVSLYELFLILTADNALRLVPVRLPDADSEQNAWNRSKRIILDQGKTNWVRMSTNRANAMYDRHLPADPSIFTEPIWPDFSRGTGDQIITEEEIFRLAFYDRGRVIDSLEHALYLKWAGRNAAR